MSLNRIFEISASAMRAQGQRLNVVASNLANADAVAGPDGEAYKARQVVFKSLAEQNEPGGVKVSDVVEVQTPGRRVFNPGHPLADETGFVTHSNVNVVEEMVNMISASRAYQNNAEIMNTTQQLMLKTLQLGQ
ncbi:MAG: flagellar basal body rod protein FlgC [Burkholderiaceae bacterium]